MMMMMMMIMMKIECEMRKKKKKKKRMFSKVFRRSIFTIGLTGGIASGKSTLSLEMEKAGCTRIDADQLGHLAYQYGSVTYNAIVKEFGEEIVDAQTKEIDRRRLAPIVFGSETKMQQLTSIVWPRIKALAAERISECEQAREQVVVLEAAVLFEAQWESLCDEVWVASVAESEAVRRLGERNGLSRDDALKRIHSQMSNAERERRADFVIDTTHRTKDETKEIVLQKLNSLLLQMQKEN